MWSKQCKIRWDNIWMRFSFPAGIYDFLVEWFLMREVSYCDIKSPLCDFRKRSNRRADMHRNRYISERAKKPFTHEYSFLWNSILYFDKRQLHCFSHDFSNCVQSTQEVDELENIPSAEGVSIRKHYPTCYLTPNPTHHISLEDIKKFVLYSEEYHIWTVKYYIPNGQRQLLLMFVKIPLEKTTNLFERRKTNKKKYEELCSELTESIPGWHVKVKIISVVFMGSLDNDGVLKSLGLSDTAIMNDKNYRNTLAGHGNREILFSPCKHSFTIMIYKIKY